jgi:hypothetical protein
MRPDNEIIGHNIILFDLPAIQKVYPELYCVSEKDPRVIDTLIWSKLCFPHLKEMDYGRFQKGMLPGQFIGRHSLEAWGYRLGEFKGNFGKTTDWKNWSKEMSDYCEQDVKVTKNLYNYLIAFSDPKMFAEALPLEHQVQWIIRRQENFGFYFNKTKGEKLYAKLLKKQQELLVELQEIFPPVVKNKGQFTPKKDNKARGYTAGGTMTKIEITPFNPSSGDHIIYGLTKLHNWKPKEFTDKGNPKTDEDVLSSLSYPEIPKLIEYMTVSKRLAQLHDGKQGWLKNVKPNSRIHGRVNTLGAVTGRMTHNNPNLAQVPAGYSPYGEECRELFCVPEGKVLLGWDASGIEARCMAHFLAPYDKGAFIKTVLEGKKEDETDIHNLNKKALEITSRDVAKTFFYAWLYGAGYGKIAKILSCSTRQAKQKVQTFLDNFKPLKKLKEDIANAIKIRNGMLKGLDGRPLYSRSPHSALNLVFQSAGAVIMKQFLVILDAELQAKFQGKYEFVCNVHDEVQIETYPEIAEEIGKIANQSIIEAGKQLGFRCPLEGEYKIGNSWEETH